MEFDQSYVSLTHHIPWHNTNHVGLYKLPRADDRLYNPLWGIAINQPKGMGNDRGQDAGKL
jgi:hypothetical protein